MLSEGTFRLDFFTFESNAVNPLRRRQKTDSEELIGCKATDPN